MDMEHMTMMVYQTYLLKNGGEEERVNQKDKMFCDGTMSKYLGCKWSHESTYVKHIIYELCTKS